MSIRNEFLKRDIPFDDIDPEMIEILEVLNLQLDLKTKFCCYGHEAGESTTIMFDDEISDKEIVKLLVATDNNLGTSGVKKVKLYKWARTMYQMYFQKPWYPKLNWVLEIEYIDEESKRQRLDEVTQSIRKLTTDKNLKYFL